MSGDKQPKGAQPGRDVQLDPEVQGALDMLLKTHYEPLPPDGYFETIWPSVEQRMEQGSSEKEDGAEAGGGNSVSRLAGGAQRPEEVVFKSSPALEALNIPEPRTRRRTTGLHPAVEDAPPTPPSAYRWPVAFVMAAAIVVGGALVYKKMNVPPRGSLARQPTMAASPVRAKGTEPAVATTATADAMVMAAVTPSADAGARAADDELGENKVAGVKTATAAKIGTTKRSPRRRRMKGPAKPTQPAATPKPASAPPAAAKPAPKAKSDTLDNLIDNALGGDAKKAKRPAKKQVAAPKSNLPKTLTREQVQDGMRRVKSLVGACYDKYQKEGTARVKVTVTPSGRVQKVRIRGKFLGTDTGRCVAKAVKKARFPRFSGDAISLTYPFVLAD